MSHDGQLIFRLRSFNKVLSVILRSIGEQHDLSSVAIRPLYFSTGGARVHKFPQR